MRDVIGLGGPRVAKRAMVLIKHRDESDGGLVEFIQP